MDCPEIEPRFLIIITEINPRKINSVNFEFHFRSIVFTLIAIARCCTIKGIVIIVQLPRASQIREIYSDSILSFLIF